MGKLGEPCKNSVAYNPKSSSQLEILIFSYSWPNCHRKSKNSQNYEIFVKNYFSIWFYWNFSIFSRHLHPTQGHYKPSRGGPRSPT